MSRIDDLIQELCPDGVDYKSLESVCHFRRGKVITQKDWNEGNYPVVSGGRKPAYYIDQYNHVGEVITVAGSGAYAGHLIYWAEPIWISDSFSVEPLEVDKLSVKFLFQCLAAKQNSIYSLKKGSGVPHVKPSDMFRIKIPVPPLEVQEEIVRILDFFAELEAELEARKKQYTYYRDKLLDFSDDKRLGQEVKWATLGEISNLGEALFLSLIPIRNGTAE